MTQQFFSNMKQKSLSNLNSDFYDYKVSNMAFIQFNKYYNENTPLHVKTANTSILFDLRKNYKDRNIVFRWFWSIMRLLKKKLSVV